MECFRYEGNPNEPNLSTIYPQDYFLVQFAFARKWSELTGTPFVDAVKFNTGIYYMLTNNVPHRIEWPKSEWQEIAKLIEMGESQDLEALTKKAFSTYADCVYASFNHARRERHERPTDFGCFSYDISSHHVNIHFTNTDRKSQPSPLSPQSLHARQNELFQMLEVIKRTRHANGKKIRCLSWLLNLPRFRELLPQEFLDQANVVIPGQTTTWYQDSLWGGFLNWKGQVKIEVGNAFLDRLDQVRRPREVMSAFPYQVLSAECDIEHFYQMYGIG